MFSTDTGTGVDNQFVSKTFSKIVKPTTLTDIDLHELRHTFTSLAALGGSSIEAVSKVLGHSSIQITTDTYQHLFRSQTQSVVGNVGKLIPRDKTGPDSADAASGKVDMPYAPPTSASPTS